MSKKIMEKRFTPNFITELKPNEVFGEEYMMHDAVIKRFDLNGDELKGDSGTMS